MDRSNTIPVKKTSSLKDELSAALPEGFRCRVRYTRTASRRSDALFSPLQGFEPEVTRLTSHFLTISTTSHTGDVANVSESVLVLGLEVLVYTTKYLTTIFVSKADSTGYLPQQRPSPVKTIATVFLQWLASKERQNHPSRKIVISLFARAQPQYLFPGSAENANKHILDDRQLIKWWARVLDPLFPPVDASSTATGKGDWGYDGYITVPGYVGPELRQFIPSNHPPSARSSQWKPGNPLTELAETRGLPLSAPTRCLLPRFPDDPKARFIQDLDDEIGVSGDLSTTASPSKRRDGKWKTIRDLDRFWEGMEFRQECSSGRVVGFIWLVMRPHSAAGHEQNASMTNDLSPTARDGKPVISPGTTVVLNGSPKRRRRKPLSGPIIPRQPRLKGGSSSLTGTSDLGKMLKSDPEDGVVLTQDGYDRAMQTLMHLDFANLEVAKKSTSKWIAEVSAIAGLQAGWSNEITGTKKSAEMAGETIVKGASQVNDLGGMIRKKRKVADQSDETATEPKTVAATVDEPQVNVLSAGMIRKKPRNTAS